MLYWCKPIMSSGNSKITYCYAVGSHVGLVRELNEDSSLALPDYGLWIIADGMGGHDAGEIASQIAIQKIGYGVSIGMSLVDAIALAHRAIQEKSGCEVGVKNMGTTVVAAKIDKLNYEIAWVGDSRAYMWGKTLRQLTSDHSYVQMLLDSGVITDKEASSHPHRNIISQALGSAGGELKIDCVVGTFCDDEMLLLCSDGLTGELSDCEIGRILNQETNVQSKVNSLIDAVLVKGGRDNVTVTIVEPIRKLRMS